MGLTKGFSQSLLAFCPPPISWKSLFSLCGGGHTANQALLDSLCKTLVIPPNTMSNLSRFSTLEHQGENPIHTTPSPFCLFSLMMHHIHCQFQLFIYFLYLASFIIHNFSGSLFCKKREKPLIMKKGYSPCHFSSLIHLLQALILILYCNFRVYETDFKLLRNPSFLILSYYGFSQSDVTLFFSCCRGFINSSSLPLSSQAMKGSRSGQTQMPSSLFLHLTATKEAEINERRDCSSSETGGSSFALEKPPLYWLYFCVIFGLIISFSEEFLMFMASSSSCMPATIFLFFLFLSMSVINYYYFFPCMVINYYFIIYSIRSYTPEPLYVGSWLKPDINI